MLRRRPEQCCTIRLSISMVRRSRARACPDVVWGRGSRRTKIVSLDAEQGRLLICGCCVIGGSGDVVPGVDLQSQKRLNGGSPQPRSRLYGIGCPRRRPMPESTPRSALLGSRRSSRSPSLGVCRRVVHGVLELYFRHLWCMYSELWLFSDSSVYSISLSSGKEPETDGWNSSPCKFRLSLSKPETDGWRQVG